MRIIVVDDEQHAINRLEKILKELTSDEVAVFDRSAYALDYAKENVVDVAFLDIEMPEMNGVELAKELKGVNPNVNVIFCTGYTLYMNDAIELHASGYLLKPADEKSVKKALDNLLYPIEEKMPHIFIRTFGYFDLFIDGVAVSFNRSKAKEMLAFLVDRCKLCNNIFNDD